MTYRARGMVVVAMRTTEQLCEDLCVLKRLEAEIKRELQLRYKAEGNINANGIYLDTRQTVSEPLPTVQGMMDGCEFIDSKWHKGMKDMLLQAALEAIPNRSWKNFYLGFPERKMLDNYLAGLPDSGLERLIGKPRLAVRTTMPNPVKVHVVEPGTEPLDHGRAAAQAEMVEDGEEDYDDYEDGDNSGLGFLDDSLYS